jgi:HlyD family secretion protein
MKSILAILVIAMGALAGVLSQFYLAGVSQPAAPDTGGKPVEAAPERIAANGVVEGAHSEAALRFEVTGIIAGIHVREGQEVQRGTVLVELANESRKHQVSLAKAELEIAKAELERLRNGERQERRTASKAVEEARRAVLEQAKADYKRSKELLHHSASASEQVEKDRFNMLRAKAELTEAAAEHALMEAAARKEDIAAAEGRVAAAKAKLHLAESDLDKTRLLARSPGRVLRVHAEPGELATPNSVQPLLTMADLSRLRVRAFIEELDAGRVHTGQRAIVTADGYPGQEFPGTVSLVIPRMGKHAPQTDEAHEYKDMYFREVLIDLDYTATELPVNLRVQVQIDSAEKAAKAPNIEGEKLTAEPKLRPRKPLR